MSQKILLVEGESDQDFFRELCKLHLDVEMKVILPKEHGSRNGKQGVINNSLPLYLKQLNDGEIAHLAVVVDADYESNNGLGFTATLKQITDNIKTFGYSVMPDSTASGLVFPHTDGLSDFGVWIMPDNALDGMLEDWLKQAVHKDEQSLFGQSVSVVKSLSEPKFKAIHTSKAEVATWLAWQKTPGQGLYAVIAHQLIDMECDSVKQLVSWLHRIYGSVPDVA